MKHNIEDDHAGFILEVALIIADYIGEHSSIELIDKDGNKRIISMEIVPSDKEINRTIISDECDAFFKGIISNAIEECDNWKDPTLGITLDYIKPSQNFLEKEINLLIEKFGENLEIYQLIRD